MDILIVTPCLIGREGAFYYFPLGLAYVSSALKHAGFIIHVINQNNINISLKEAMAEVLRTEKIKVVCTGGLTPDYQSACEIFDIAREINQDITTVCGGGLVSSEPEIVCKGLGVDIGVCGEGEETIVEVMKNLNSGNGLEHVRGIVFRKSNGEYQLTAGRPPISNLDEIVFPDFESFGIEEYLNRQFPNAEYSTCPVDNPRTIQIIGSRSCPFKCTFCYHPLGNSYRQRSLDNIFKEIDFLIERYDVNTFMLYDELFASRYNEDRVKEFCSRIKKRKVFWRVSLRVDIVTSDLLNMMRDSGCHYIAYGIENISDKILLSMRKKITKSQIENALRLTYEAGLGVQGNLLFGDTEETLETIQENIEWWKENLHYQLHLVPLATYPGSCIYNDAVARGIIKDKSDYITKADFYINNTNLPDSEYVSMCTEIHDIQKQYLIIEAEVVEYQKDPDDIFGRPTSSYVVCCPHCKTTVKYKNIVNQEYTSYNIHPDMHKLSCRHCNQRFDILASPAI